MTHQATIPPRMSVDGDALLEHLTYLEGAVTALHAVSEQANPTEQQTNAVAYLAGRISDHIHDICRLCEAAHFGARAGAHQTMIDRLRAAYAAYREADRRMCDAAIAAEDERDRLRGRCTPEMVEEIELRWRTSELSAVWRPALARLFLALADALAIDTDAFDNLTDDLASVFGHARDAGMKIDEYLAKAVQQSAGAAVPVAVSADEQGAAA